MRNIIRFMINDQVKSGLLINEETIKEITGDIYTKITEGNETYNLEQVKLISPCTPTKVVGVGLNYHCVRKEKNSDSPAEPIIFLKPSSSVIGPEETIRFPRGCQELNYEVELGVVIKKVAREVAVEEALDYVLGYTCANDVTAKDFMVKGQPWTRGKCFDTSMPLGPSILTYDDEPIFQLKMYHNNIETQNESTSDMIFNVQEIISYISGWMTLYPGDVIITGTPTGKGKLNKGDKIVGEIEQIGKLVNYVE